MDSSAENITFQPGVGEYPPNIRIPKGASLLAHIHELGHAEFDAENGSPGICYYMQHPDVIIDTERRAYGLEITMATADGYAELAKRLERNLEAEVRRIEGR